MEIFKIITLALSGLLLVFVGSMRLANPIKTYAKNSEIKLENDPSLLNEMRGVSAVMLCSGIIALLGIIVTQLTTISFVVAGLIFLGFAVGRILSIAVDGKPSKEIVQGLMFEFVLGILNGLCLVFTFA